MATKKRGAVKLTEPATPVSFVTYLRPDSYTVGQLRGVAMSCVNGDMRIQPYRVTIEPVPLTDEELRARLVKLWRVCGNYNHWAAFQTMATELGITLDRKERGADLDWTRPIARGCKVLDDEREEPARG